MTECFNFYGLVISVTSTAAAIVDQVRRSFAYFRVDAAVGAVPEHRISIDIQFVPPPYADLPSLPASFVTPRNVCYRSGSTSYIDYFGKGLAVFDRQRKTCTVYGTDADLVHEIVYLFVLSTVGQHLDQRHLHRVHALGVSYRGRGVLLLLPSGGGKSTMALQLLRQPGFLLLAEDTPLIDRRGRMLPFPLRVGVRPEQKIDVPLQHVRTVNRMEFDPKTLIDIDYFRDRLGGPVDARLLFVGQRNLGDLSEIVPLARHRALRALVKYTVVGLGVYQGLEFLLERGLPDLVGKSGVAASRLYNSLQLIARTSAYRFVLGRDPEKNCGTLISFLDHHADVGVP